MEDGAPMSTGLGSEWLTLPLPALYFTLVWSSSLLSSPVTFWARIEKRRHFCRLHSPSFHSQDLVIHSRAGWEAALSHCSSGCLLLPSLWYHRCRWVPQKPSKQASWLSLPPSLPQLIAKPHALTEGVSTPHYTLSMMVLPRRRLTKMRPTQPGCHFSLPSLFSPRISWDKWAGALRPKLSQVVMSSQPQGTCMLSLLQAAMPFSQIIISGCDIN